MTNPFLSEAAKGPRRRVVMELHIGADDWESLQGTLRHLETEIAMHGKLSTNLVSGGYSSGHWFTTNEDETITHDSWAEANEAYCANLATREKGGGS